MHFQKNLHRRKNWCLLKESLQIIYAVWVKIDYEKSFIPQLVEKLIVDKNGGIQAANLYQNQTNLLQCLKA